MEHSKLDEEVLNAIEDLEGQKWGVHVYFDKMQNAIKSIYHSHGENGDMAETN